MSRTFFGWSYPPGRSGPPDDYMPDPHPKSEEMYDLLEQAGVPQDIIHKTCGIVDSLATELDRECPRCAKRDAEEMKQALQENYWREAKLANKLRTDGRGPFKKLGTTNYS